MWEPEVQEPAPRSAGTGQSSGERPPRGGPQLGPERSAVSRRRRSRSRAGRSGGRGPVLSVTKDAQLTPHGPPARCGSPHCSTPSPRPGTPRTPTVLQQAEPGRGEGTRGLTASSVKWGCSVRSVQTVTDTRGPDRSLRERADRRPLHDLA